MCTLPPHPESGRIATAIARLRRAPPEAGGPVLFDEVAYRAAHPKYATMPELLSGTGSLILGSRWKSPSSMRVLHAAGEPEQAIAEALAVRRRSGLPLCGELPLTVRAVRVVLSAVLDLRLGSVRLAIRVSTDRLRNVDWRAENARGMEALTQAIGRSAAAVGFEGLLVESAAVPGATNVVAFVDCLVRGSIVEPVDSG